MNISEFAIRDRHCYMDNAATTVMDQAVVEAMIPYLEERYGNPETAYALGSESLAAVEIARAQVAVVLGCKPERVFFTSGGTESNNWAIKGAARSGCIVTSQVEHASILEPVGWLTRCFPAAYTTAFVGVDSMGRVDMDNLKQEMENGDVKLVSVQFGNNEVGTLQPVKEIAGLCHQRGVIFHCDACQAFGKMEFDVDDYGFDLLSISAHKIHGPMGMGALYIKKGVDIEPLLHGGGHESGMRSGTVAVPSIVGFGKAAEIARNNMGDMKRVSRMVEMIAGSLVGGCGAVRNGDPVNRLPHILSLTLPRLPGAALVGDLSQKGVCVSMGSACRTRRRKSHVLEAMGLDHEKNNHTIRISPSRYTEDMDAFLLIQAIQQADKNPRKLEYL